MVLSEVGYFLTSAELADVLEKVAISLRPGGELLMCHWLHPVKGWPMDGTQVHALARRILDGAPIFSEREADYVLEVFSVPEDGRG